MVPRRTEDQLEVLVREPPASAATAIPEAIGEDQFRLLADNAPILCWIANADGHIFWYNRRWHEYCGTTAEAMAGWGWQSVHDPAVLPAVLERWTAAIRDGDRFEMVFPLRGADGIFRPFLTRVDPLRDRDGGVIRWCGVNIDISAQSAAEDQLRAANAQLQAIVAEREAILSQLGESVIVTGADGRINFVNDAAKRLHGVAVIDVEPDDYTTSYSLFTEAGEPHPVETLPLTRAVRDHETVVDARWRIRRPQGDEVLVIGSAKPVRGRDGGVIGAVLTIRDDTERRASEAALAEAVQIKDMLLHEVNHRVKNSLQMVSSLLMLQAGKATSPALKQGLLEARGRIAVVAALHERLYTTGLHDSVDLAQYLRDLATDTIDALDDARRITLDFACAGGIALPLDRAVPLALLVSEILSNAVKYAFSGDRPGRVGLAIDRAGEAIDILITDDGCGLPLGFDPARSVGLGMRIVLALVRQLQGTLTLPTTTAGAAFRIALPAIV